MRDYPVKPKSRDDIRRLAADLRRQLKISDFSSVRMLEIFEQKLPSLGGVFAGLQIVRQPTQLMNGVPAYTHYGPNKSIRVFVEEDTYLAASKREALSEKILAHELGHVILHGEQPKAFLAGIFDRIGYLDNKESSAEWQADTYQLGFQVTDRILSQYRSVKSLTSNFNVTEKDAVTAIALYERATATRPVPESYDAYRRSYLQSIRRADGDLPIEASKLWATLGEAPGHEADDYRLCPNGFLICRQEFEKMTPCGWHVRHGMIAAHYSTMP